jgi:hypothetical protein
MKMKRFFGILIMTTLFVILASGCATTKQANESSQKTRVNESSQQAANADIAALLTPFNGSWEITDEQNTTYLECHGHAYTFFVIENGKRTAIGDRGVFRYDESKITLQNDTNDTLVVSYTLTNDKLTLSSITGSGIWMNGVWTKLNLSPAYTSNFLIGTWVGATKNGFGIAHFYWDGSGFYYGCDKNYVVEYVAEIEWEPNKGFYNVVFDVASVQDKYVRQGNDMLVNNSILYKKVGAW